RCPTSKLWRSGGAKWLLCSCRTFLTTVATTNSFNGLSRREFLLQESALSAISSQAHHRASRTWKSWKVSASRMPYKNYTDVTSSSESSAYPKLNEVSELLNCWLSVTAGLA